MAFADPVVGLDASASSRARKPGRKEVMTASYPAHDDPSGPRRDESAASKLIGDVAEARRILLG